MFYVYLLQSKKDKSLYVGQTENLEERVTRHNNGFVPSTKKKAPWHVIGYEEYKTRNEARWREYQIKQSYSKKKEFIRKFLSS